MVRNHRHTSGNEVAAATAPRCLTKLSCLAVTAAWRNPVRSMQSSIQIALPEVCVTLKVSCRSGDLMQLSAEWNLALSYMHARLQLIMTHIRIHPTFGTAPIPPSPLSHYA